MGCQSSRGEQMTIYRILLGGERHGESKVFFPKTQLSDPAWSWTQTSRPADQRNDHQPTVSPINDENEFDVFCCLSFHPEHRQLAAQLARCRFCFENPDIAKHLIIAIGLKVGWAVCYFRLIPVHPNISIHILLALLYTFPLLLLRRIGLIIRASQVGDRFLYSHDRNEWLSSITVRRK